MGCGGLRDSFSFADEITAAGVPNWLGRSRVLAGANCIGYTERGYHLDSVFSGLTSSSFLESHTRAGGIHEHCPPLGRYRA